MNDMVIGDGNFSTDYLEKLDPRELLGVDKQGEHTAATRAQRGEEGEGGGRGVEGGCGRAVWRRLRMRRRRWRV